MNDIADRTPAERRTGLGLSRMQLAAILGIDVTTVWRYETRPEQHSPPPWYLLALEALEGRVTTRPPR